MVAEVTPAVLQDVLNYLDVTWADPALENKYKSMILSGMVYLDTKLGTSADYETPGLPNTLLKEYVRYMRDGALDVFTNNYLDMILSMQNGKKVKDYAAAESTISGE